MRKISAIVVSLFLALPFGAQSSAQLDSFDIVGLTIGKSTRAEVKNIYNSLTELEDGRFVGTIVIGEFEIAACTAEFIDDIFSLLDCPIGGDFFAIEEKKYQQASNIYMYEVLLKGYTKKFGTPTHVNEEIVTNGLGKEFTKSTREWESSNGDKISLVNIHNKTTRGRFTVKSREFIIKEAEEEKAREESLKF